MKSNSGYRIKYFLELSKLKIMVPVSLTGFTGYFIYNPHLSLNLFLVTLGILLQAISASVLNQIQEADLDARMARTHDRPLPAGKISLRDALFFFFFTLISGSVILYFSGNIRALVIGIITIVWYNGVYTYSKRITAFAVVPGAVTGTLPPLIGWVAAGGGLWDKPILFLGFLFFTGQVPHFWLLVMKYGDEYHKAGLPSLTVIMSHRQINNLTFTWVVTSVTAAIFLCYFEIIKTHIISACLLAASVFLIFKFSELIRTPVERNNYGKYSALLDSYFLLLLILLISDRIIG